VQRFTFEAFTPQDERLEAVTIAPLTAPGPVQAAFFYVAAGGRIARHPAVMPQLLAVVAGEGLVSGAEGDFEPIAAGEAVFWAAGEEHETVSDYGLTALVVEAEGLTLRR
jgi:quercetin dioxygenase-like cupin family protein